MTGELALVEEGLLAGDGGDGDRRETGLGDLLQRPAHQLQLEQGEAALEAVGAAARDLDDAAELSPIIALDQGNMLRMIINSHDGRFPGRGEPSPFIPKQG